MPEWLTAPVVVVQVLAMIGTAVGALGVSRWGRVEVRADRVRSLAETRQILVESGADVTDWDEIMADAMLDVPGRRVYAQIRTAKAYALMGAILVATIPAFLFLGIVNAEDAGWLSGISWVCAAITAIGGVVTLTEALILGNDAHGEPGLLASRRSGVSTPQATEAPSEPPSGAPEDSGSTGAA